MRSSKAPKKKIKKPNRGTTTSNAAKSSNAARISNPIASNRLSKRHPHTPKPTRGRGSGGSNDDNDYARFF